LRASRAGISLDSIATTPAFRAALFRQRSLQQFYSAGLAPGDWPSFIRLALEAERDLHLGSSGVTDETFYAPLFEYLRTRRAPPDAVAAVSFTHALAGWDFERARTAGDTVSRALVSGISWVDADMLREGLVVANLRTGNVAAARRAFDDLRRYSTRPAQSLRALLIEAYLTSAESTGSVASGGGTGHRAASAAR
jgi:hypothetical protein